MDPYRQWLEIREQRRPLSHYELLNLRPFESDSQLIQKAYGEQMARARRYQVGAHMDLAQRIISELSEAFVCLNDPRRKEAYDGLLRSGETVDQQILPTVEVPTPTEAKLQPVPMVAPPRPSTPVVAQNPSKRSTRDKPRFPIVMTAACGVTAVAVVALIVWSRSGQKQESVAQSRPKAVPQPFEPPRQSAPAPKPAVTQQTEPDKPPEPMLPIEEKPAPPAITPPENPPAPPASTPPQPSPQTTTANPPAKPTPKAPQPIQPVLPNDWAERVAQSEDIWKALDRPRGASRHVLSGEFVALEEGNAPVVHVKFERIEATLPGPFSPEGLGFVRQLQPKDPVQLGIRAVNAKSAADRVTLLWMSRVGLQELPRVACRATAAPRSIAPDGLQRALHSVAWSPDSKKLLVCSEPALLVDAETGEVLQRVSEADGTQGGWSSDGRYLALEVDSLPPPANAGQGQVGGGLGFGVPSMPNRGGVLVYDTTTRKQVTALYSSAYGEALFGFRPKGTVLAAVHDAPATNIFNVNNKVLMQYNFAGGKWQSQLVEQFVGTARLAWKQDGTQLAWTIQGLQNSVKVLSAGSRGQPLQIPLNVTVSDLTWVPNSKLLAVFGGQMLHVSDVLSAKKDGSGFKLSGISRLKHCSFSASGRLAAVLRNQVLEVWRLTDEAAPLWSVGNNNWQAVAWSPSDAVLAGMNSSGAVTLWDEDGAQIATLSSKITASSQAELAWSPSGQWLAVCGQNNSFVIYDVSQF